MRIVFEELPLRLPSGETATLAAPFAMGTGAGAINPAIRRVGASPVDRVG